MRKNRENCQTCFCFESALNRVVKKACLPVGRGIEPSPPEADNKNLNRYSIGAQTRDYFCDRNKDLKTVPENLSYETKLWSDGYDFIAGIDEAGRGPLAGPVVAAAVIFPKEFYCGEINDSKKLSAKKREKLFSIIKKNALSIGLGFVREETIDKVNIRQASLLAMEKAVNRLKVKPDYILIDGKDKIHQKFIPQFAIVNGDSLSFTVSAASIIAKNIRDRIMDRYNRIFPEYKFSEHKGYGTREHLFLLEKYGVSPIHRKSYRPVSGIIQKRVKS